MLPTPTPIASASTGIVTSMPSRAKSSPATASARSRFSTPVSDDHGRASLKDSPRPSGVNPSANIGIAIPLLYSAGRNAYSASLGEGEEERRGPTEIAHRHPWPQHRRRPGAADG